MRSQKLKGRSQKERSTSPQPSPQGGEGEVLTLARLSEAGVVGLTKEQMAAALQVSVRTLNGMMGRGEISYYKIGSKLVRFRLEDALKRMGETVLVTAVEGGRLSVEGGTELEISDLRFEKGTRARLTEGNKGKEGRRG